MKVKCAICNKDFEITPSRSKNKNHCCSRQCMGKLSSLLHSKKVKINCKICNKECFYRKSHIKQVSNPTCSRLCASKSQSQRYRGKDNPKALGLSDYEKIWWNKNTDLRTRAKAKNIEFDLDYKFLMNLYEKQQRKCFYTDLPLKIYKKGENSKIAFDTLSVDRVDSFKGYTKDNIVLCLNSINMLKADHCLDDIKMIMKAIMIKENKDITVRFKKLYKDSQLPAKSNPLAAGHDLYSHRIEDCGNHIKIFTGIAAQPDSGYWLMLAPRSSAYKKGLVLYNSLGIIDPDYTGEIIGIFYKTKDYLEPAVGDRLLQIIPQKTVKITCVEVDELSTTERGEGGFGSSGK